MGCMELEVFVFCYLLALEFIVMMNHHPDLNATKHFLADYDDFPDLRGNEVHEMNIDEMVDDMIAASHANERYYIMSPRDFSRFLRSPRGELVDSIRSTIFGLQLVITTRVSTGRLGNRAINAVTVDYVSTYPPILWLDGTK